MHDCSFLNPKAVSMSTENKRSSSMVLTDWTQLPEELLQVISEKMDNCFDVVHARSVCSLWRSTIPFPSSPSYSLPMFNEVSLENEGLCTLKKIPFFLFRVPTLAPAASADEYFMGGIVQDESEEDHMEELPSPIQYSVKVKIRESEPTLMNMLNCQILSLGHQYRLMNWNPDGLKKPLRTMAFIPINKEGRIEFVLLLNYKGVLWVLTSGAKMKWKRLENVRNGSCWNLVTFRGRFYASFIYGTSVVIDPYSLDVTLLMPSQPLLVTNYLVPYGNDELFLVQRIASHSTYRVSRLDEEAGKWVEVSHLGDRVLFINHPLLGNICCSAKEFPNGCGVIGNSVVVTYEAVGETFFYKSVNNRWILSKEIRGKILSNYPVVAFRVKHASP
ncbi:unnamed protein product [Microthlaspi erraticum]|uniref:F-box domain-containing protein n=1 Tax=Microthlaspi erraticum TaxID=1685480 RepID=A0A6D2J6U1_9BRAS|nr:unnamed protein product [Microthlaspi erraticum]